MLPYSKYKKVCHLTTVHNRYDTRIFVKECNSLKRNGFEVHLIVADGKGHEVKNGVFIHDLGRPVSRIQRILTFSSKMFAKAKQLNADLYHFHDPELLKIGSKLAKGGKKVVYDAHEDVPRQLLTKSYIPSVLKRTISNIFERFEDRLASKMSGIVTATPLIRNRFLRSNKTVVEVQNFPFIQEFINETDSSQIESKAVCYVGSITKVRGIITIIDALRHTGDTKLLLGGEFESNQLRETAKQSQGWTNVIELGFLDRVSVQETMARSIAGLVVLEPAINYLDSIPVKMFEYMAAGIPVIASDFDYWKELIGHEDCAIFVDPLNPEEIANAINTLSANPSQAKKMGRRGRTAVFKKFNWEPEEKKLLALYEKLLF